MIVSKYVLFLAVIANASIAFEKPIYKPPFRKNQPIRSNYQRRSQIPTIQVNSQEVSEVTKPQDPSHLFDYFKRLAAVEANLDKLVSNAKDYQTGKNELEEAMRDNESLTNQDKKDLLERYTQELKEKFFPRRASPIRRSATGN